MGTHTMDSRLISLSVLLLFLPQDVFPMDAAEVQVCGSDWEDSRGQTRSLTIRHPSRHWTLPIKWSFVAQEDWRESGYKGLDTNKYFGLTKADIDRTREAIKYIEDRTCIRFKEVNPNKDDDWMLVRRVAQAPIGASDRTPSKDFRCLFGGGANRLGAFNDPPPRKSDWIRYKLYGIYKAIDRSTDKCFSGATATTGMGRPARLSLHLATPKLSLMVHELLHIIGLSHTQHRRDAKDHIQVQWQNIEKWAQFTYIPYTNSRYYETYKIPYDCNSIMHYSPRAFSKNGRPTMKAIHPEKCKLKYNADMSEYDKQFVQEMYKKQCSVTQGRLCGDLDIGVNTVCADCGRKVVALTNTAEECRDICYNRQSCKHWIWHTHQAGGWSKQCMLIDRLEGINKVKDTNTVSGACKESQPPPNGRLCDHDIGVNTVCADCGRKVVALTNTAEECRDICYNRQSCKHWIWHTHQAGGWSKQCMLIDRLEGI